MLFSDTIVGVFVGVSLTAWITFLVFLPKPIEEQIEENKKEWLLTHKAVSGKMEDPRDWRQQAVLFWMGSWLLFALQLIIQGSSALFASSELDAYAFWLGFVFLLLGVFRSYHIGEFLGNRKYYPRVGIAMGVQLVAVSLIDLLYMVVFVSVFPFFNVASLIGKAFILMIPLAIVDTWVLTKFILDKRKHSRRVTLFVLYFPIAPIAFLLSAALALTLL